MSVPLLLLMVLLLTALLLATLQRWPRVTAVVGAAVGGGLATWLATLALATAEGAPAEIWTWGDFSLSLTPALPALGSLLTAGVALLALLRLRFPGEPLHLPAAFAALAPLLAALMVTPFTVGAVLLVMGAALLVVALQPRMWDTDGSALRYLLLTALAAPLLLVAGWLLSGGGSSAVLPTTRLVGLAMALLLGGFPFYTWIRPLLVKGSPLAATLLLGLVPVGLAAYLLPLSAALLPAADELLQISGVGAALVAALLAATAVTLRDLWAAAVLLDVGLALMLPTEQPLGAALAPFIVRSGGLLLSGVGVLLLEATRAPALLDGLMGWARKRPLAFALFLYGCFSLVGAPLTPGFVGRWALLTGWGAADVAWWLAGLGLLALAIVAYRLLRLFVIGLRPLEDGG